MNAKRIITLTTIILASATIFTSCSKEEGCTDPAANNYNVDTDKDDGSCTYDPIIEPVTSSKITFDFTHNFDGASVTNANFNQFNFVTAFGDTMNIINNPDFQAP